MKYSLISRDWIADCVEIMHEAYAAVSKYMVLPIICCHGYISYVSYCAMLFQDAIIALGGCDKTGKMVVGICCSKFLRVAFPKHLSIDT